MDRYDLRSKSPPSTSAIVANAATSLLLFENLPEGAPMASHTAKDAAKLPDDSVPCSSNVLGALNNPIGCVAQW